MELDLTDEQRMLVQTIGDFVRREAPHDKVGRVFQRENGYDAAMFERAAGAGWLGMLVPEAYGGLGLPVTDCAVAFEEFGKAPLPGPLFTSGILATLILLEAGTQQQKEQVLPEVALGETKIAVAAIDSGIGWGPDLVRATFRRDGDRLFVSGRKPFVHDADAADLFICLVVEEGAPAGKASLLLVDRSAAGVAVESCSGLITGVSSVRLDSVAVPADSMLGIAGRGWADLERATQRALPIMSAFMVGGCIQVFEFTLEYTRIRHAFGQPIGRFQRVQDHVVDIANAMDGASLITSELLWKLERDRADPADIHEAAAVAKEAYYQACNFSHMVHAGPGTDLDHPLMAHTLVSRSLYQYLGDPTYHRQRMMDIRYPA